MQERKKILFLLSRFPYPLIKGDKLRAYYQIKELSKTCDVYLCALSDEKVDKESIEALRDYCTEIHVFKLKLLPLIGNLFRYLFFSKKPIQVGYFYQKAISRKINSILQSTKVDHVFCQLIRTAEYVRYNQSADRSLDYMDALSAGMDRRAESSKGLKKWIFQLEASRLKKYEHEVFKDFNHAFVISKSDRSLIFHYENENIHVLPNGIDLEFFSPLSAKKDKDLLFTGNMSYPPNIQSAEYLIKEIMPLVWVKKPETSVLISGANPSSSVKSLASDKVKVEGWVEDIRTSYSNSKIFTAPMLIGSGLQNKLLEAMAMKMPCVSSALANLSLGAKEGESILIGRSTDEYAQHILYLLENKEKAKEMGEKGHSFVSSKFSWSESNEILLEAIKHGKA